MTEYLSLSEAWELIPRFDGDDPHDASSIIKACMYAAKKIDPKHKPDLLESVLNTKIQGTAAIVLKRNNVTTFEELKVQLGKLYPLKRPLIVVKSEFKNCRQRDNESLNGFIVRFKRLMNELMSAWSEGVKTPREKWTLRKLVRHMALHIFVKGLKDIYSKTKKRCYPELSIAILGAMEEEKLRKFPHLDKITCYWCGSKGHVDEDCFIRMWVERNRQRVQSRRARARVGRRE